jgi:general secretion pathway protein G
VQTQQRDEATQHGATAARWRRRARAGFTLIELLVVIVIISVLAVVVVPRVLDRPDQARVARAKQDVATLENALKFYRIDNHVYPSTEQGLAALRSKPATEPQPANWAAGGYIDRIPDDPWGNAYQYLFPGLRGEFDVFSFGSDGKPGGEGVAADLGNWASQ